MQWLVPECLKLVLWGFDTLDVFLFRAESQNTGENYHSWADVALPGTDIHSGIFTTRTPSSTESTQACP